MQWGFPIATILSLNKPYQSIESKLKNKKKEWGEHQRIYIRRSIKRKLQKQWWRLGEIKAHGLRSMGRLFLNYKK
ncbi:MAG: hypothetical protein EBT92_06485 [Planctomycetes bacterium]|nr:hypothetical protein [Planctomycetota bacterium]